MARHSFGPLGVILYANGTSVASFNANARSGSLDSFAPLRLGASSDVTPTSFWDGRLDEVEIFNRELRPVEIADIAAAAGAGKCKCAPLSSAPVAWWTFDESGATATATDIAGHFSGPHDATLIDAAHASGKVGGALLLNGTSAYGNVAAGSLLDLDLGPGDGFSVDAWIYTGSTGSLPIVANVWAPADAPLGYSFSLEGGALSFFVDSAGGTCTLPACSNLADNTWHLVGATVTHDPGGKNVAVRLYVDGQLAQSFPSHDVIPGAHAGGFVIGFYPGIGRFAPNLYFSGKLDELEIFDHPLTEKDFSTIYTAGSAGKCKPAVRTQTCGIPGASPCAAGQFCDYLAISQCGVVPLGGLCRNKAEVCNFDENLVCGCDGNTYGNDCFASVAGISIAHAGACP